MEQEKKSFVLPLSILIAGVMISVSVIYAVGSGSGGTVQLPPDQQEPEPVGDLDALAPVTKDDHLLGSLKAPVKLIEFSDLECPFCKRFHPTAQQIFDEYGKDGKVAWVFRQFPLAQLHSKAPIEAEATECAGKLGGNDVFWKYLGKIFEVTPANNGLDLAQLPVIAGELGLDKVAFSKCLDSHETKTLVDADYEDAVATGGQGTPWSIIVAANGKKFPVNGAQPYEVVKEMIEAALKEK